MNDDIAADTLLVDSFSGFPDWNFFATTLLFCLGAFLLGFFFGRKKSQQGSTSKRSRKVGGREKHEVDYDNVIGSAFDARPLAKKLKVLCHPDRFVGDETRMKLAEELHQQVMENSHNLNELKLLEKRIENELGEG